MKKIYLILALVLSMLAGARVAYAQTPGARLTQAADRHDARVTLVAQKQTTALTNLQQRADTMITERIDSLNKLLTRIQSDSRLADADKTNLTNDIQSTISALGSLKTKIDADTDLATARTDAKTIVTSYHVYAIFEPKIRILVIINNLTTLANTIKDLQSKTQALVNTQKANGTDTTAMQKALDDITAQLADITTRLTSDKTTIGNISVTQDISTAQKTFAQVRLDLATVRQDFASIRADFTTLRQQFKINMGKGTVSPKPTHSATESAK